MNISYTYAEVYEILNLLGADFIDKLPKGLYKHIDDERDKKYWVELDITKTIQEQNISDDATEMITYLNLQYWCTEEEKEKLMKEYENNDKIYNNKLLEKYNPDDLFKKEESTQNNEQLPTLLVKENILIKILKKISCLFKRK